MIDVNKLNACPYKLAIWTDHADFVTEIEDTQTLLEVRAFGETGECRAFRSTSESGFSVREINNEAEKPENAFDENQYLDIDTAKPESKNDGWIYTTGGGRYHLPYENLPDIHSLMLKVRYYYTFDEVSGVARKTDWRLVGFAGKESV